MLVLTRKVDESIMVGKDIEIKILGTEEGRVKIGISAPKDIEIFRKEIYAEILNENREASNQNKDFEKLKIIFKKD